MSVHDKCCILLQLFRMFTYFNHLFLVEGISLDIVARNCHTPNINSNTDVGTSCYHECEVTDMTDQYYVAIRKTVIYYHYDEQRLVTIHLTLFSTV